MTDVTAAMLVIGDEVLSGRTQDANTQVLAKLLGEIGIQLREGRAIADDQGAIVEAVNALRARYDYVFTSGGIGPTHDDITAEAVGKAFDAHTGIRDDARKLLEDHYGDEINEGRLRMARIPDGASLIRNPVSIAPGFRLENVFVMAGVPKIFAAMLDDVRTQLSGGAKVHEISLVVPVPEGELSGPLGKVAAAHPSVSIGSYPRMLSKGGFSVTVVARSTDVAALTEAEAALREMMDTFPTAPSRT